MDLTCPKCGACVEENDVLEHRKECRVSGERSVVALQKVAELLLEAGFVSEIELPDAGGVLVEGPQISEVDAAKANSRLLVEEVEKQVSDFPTWPSDPIHAAAVVASEAGELVQAALDFFHLRDDKPERIQEAAVRVGAKALRFLSASFGYKRRDPRGK